MAGGSSPPANLTYRLESLLVEENFQEIIVPQRYPMLRSTMTRITVHSGEVLMPCPLTAMAEIIKIDAAMIESGLKNSPSIPPTAKASTTTMNMATPFLTNRSTTSYIRKLVANFNRRATKGLYQSVLNPRFTLCA
jgi:hypothetical protein